MSSTPLDIALPEELTLSEQGLDTNSIQIVKHVYLDDIVCGSRFSGLISSEGDLWLCGNFKPQAPKKDEEEEKQEQIAKDKEFAAFLANDNAHKKGGQKRKDTQPGSKGKGKKDREAQKSARGQKYLEHTESRDKEKLLKHRFINMTPLVSQKAFGKNYCVDNIWFAHKTIITRCRYSFSALE